MPIPQKSIFKRGVLIATKVGVAPEDALLKKMQAEKNVYMVSKKELLVLFKNHWKKVIMITTDISHRDTNFRLWDRGQMVAILSQTEEGEKNSIFSGNKTDKLKSIE